MYFSKLKEAPTVTIPNGTVLKVMACDDKMTMLQSTMPAGLDKPPHTHSEIQAYYIVSGKMELEVGEEKKIMEAGDTCIVPSMIPHGAKIIEETTEIEIFYPARPDLIHKYFPNLEVE